MGYVWWTYTLEDVFHYVPKYDDLEGVDNSFLGNILVEGLLPSAEQR